MNKAITVAIVALALVAFLGRRGVAQPASAWACTSWFQVQPTMVNPYGRGDCSQWTLATGVNASQISPPPIAKQSPAPGSSTKASKEQRKRTSKHGR